MTELPISATRTCLKCLKPFRSGGPGHRICPKCVANKYNPPGGVPSRLGRVIKKLVEDVDHDRRY